MRHGSMRALFFAAIFHKLALAPSVPGEAIQTEASDDILTETDETIETES
jgi:hypothetical protein